ncbi:hypothetical protein GYMLUDRAFT_814090 [Collybiopsis luxurians FD-317 M1]|nr:hypothetical protein GYMLUDRAFT_814090 [Collybiopsis luxurians FD-317 M1]
MGSSFRRPEALGRGSMISISGDERNSVVVGDDADVVACSETECSVMACSRGKRAIRKDSDLQKTPHR